MGSAPSSCKEHDVEKPPVPEYPSSSGERPPPGVSKAPKYAYSDFIEKVTVALHEDQKSVVAFQPVVCDSYYVGPEDIAQYANNAARVYEFLREAEESESESEADVPKIHPLVVKLCTYGDSNHQQCEKINIIH
jgi:hypothetical protein